MKKNYFIKKPKRVLIAFLVLFCGLFANTITAQTAYTWNGPVDGTGDWTTDANWLPSTGHPGSGAGTTDTATISNGANVTLSASKTIAVLTISNASGAVTGSSLTINSGVILTASNSAGPIVLNGGNIVNNGEIIANCVGAGTGATVHIFACGTPPQAPGSGTINYGYTGGATSKLGITINSSQAGGSSAFNINSVNANSKYNFVFNGISNTVTFGATLNTQSFTIRTAASASQVSIGGNTGLTTNRGLLLVSADANVTVESGTTLTSTLPATFAQHSIILSNNSTFINKGIINISGSNTQNGIQINGVTGTLTFNNEGTININTAISTASRAALCVQNGSNTGIVTINNTGIMNLKNTIGFTATRGYAYFVVSPTNSTVNFTNNGSLNFSGTNINNGGSLTTLTNNGTITANNALQAMTVTNNSGKTIAFVKDASTIAATNALTTTITFASNAGVIQTATGATQLNNLAGVATLSSSSSIEPGGATGKGIASFSAAPFTILGTLKLQVAGNTAAGTDYDQVNNVLTDGGFTIGTGAILDVTGISGIATPVDIIVANGLGTITGTFDSVIGLSNGWSVNYGATGKVQLVYSAISPSTNTWDGSESIVWTDPLNWSTGIVPDQNSNVVIANVTNQPTITTNVNINSLTINTGATLTANGPNLTVTGDIANSGTMTLANNSNLIQGGTTNSNTGNITVNRNSNALSRLDFTSWSSPVTNASQFLTTFSPATSLNRFYNYNETTNAYNEITTPTTPASTTFTAGTGYLIRMPNTHPTSPTIWNGSFSGVPNNGTINKAITYSGTAFGYNMVGNPYPSTIDAQAFIAANTANIESSLYFWRKINAASGSAYAVYNPLGSTTATPSSALPNGTIQVGQGFFLKAKSGATTVSFTNVMRVANNNNQFFKSKAVQKDRVWLNLTNTAGVFNQALIGYTADATIGIDMYDAKYFNDSKVALTSNINDEEYTIQGRPTFDATDVVALNFKTDAEGDYTIALDHFDGVFATGQDVYLVDSKTGIETDLKAGSYTFNAKDGIDNTRFNLKYQKTLKVDAAAFNENSVSVYKNNGNLYINSGSVAINTIEIYDVQGRLLASQRNVKATTATISNLRAINQVLIVTISDENNSIVSKKVVN